MLTTTTPCFDRLPPSWRGSDVEPAANHRHKSKPSPAAVCWQDERASKGSDTDSLRSVRYRERSCPNRSFPAYSARRTRRRAARLPRAEQVAVPSSATLLQAEQQMEFL